MKGLAYSPSRWHGIADSTVVGGDVHTDTDTITVDTVAVTATTVGGDVGTVATIDTVTTATTTNHAAYRFDISGDSASGI